MDISRSNGSQSAGNVPVVGGEPVEGVAGSLPEGLLSKAQSIIKTVNEAPNSPRSIVDRNLSSSPIEEVRSHSLPEFKAVDDGVKFMIDKINVAYADFICDSTKPDPVALDRSMFCLREAVVEASDPAKDALKISAVVTTAKDSLVTKTAAAKAAIESSFQAISEAISGVVEGVNDDGLNRIADLIGAHEVIINEALSSVNEGVSALDSAVGDAKAIKDKVVETNNQVIKSFDDVKSTVGVSSQKSARMLVLERAVTGSASEAKGNIMQTTAKILRETSPILNEAKMCVRKEGVDKELILADAVVSILDAKVANALKSIDEASKVGSGWLSADGIAEKAADTIDANICVINEAIEGMRRVIGSLQEAVTSRSGTAGPKSADVMVLERKIAEVKALAVDIREVAIGVTDRALSRISDHLSEKKQETAMYLFSAINKPFIPGTRIYDNKPAFFPFSFSQLKVLPASSKELPAPSLPPTIEEVE